MADVTVQNEGSIVLLNPITEVAQEWWEEMIAGDVMMFGNAFVVEWRYVYAIVEGMIADGLEVLAVRTPRP